MPLKTNVDRLIMTNVYGEAAHPATPGSIYSVSHDGRPLIVPSVGGVTLNVRVGDPAFGWVADHLEPGVSTRHPDDAVNRSYCVFACIGNPATVISGDAKGDVGIVVGKHGGIEHVMIDFPRKTLEKMQIGDKVGVRAHGVGLELADAGDIKLFNCGPDLLDAWKPKFSGGRLGVQVAKVVPAAIMGSGLGRDTVVRGDYDIQAFDDAIVEQYGLRDLRLGDIVAIHDADNSFGRIFKTGAISVGVVVHGSSHVSGHGPGVTTLATSSTGAIDIDLDANANLANLFKLR